MTNPKKTLPSTFCPAPVQSPPFTLRKIERSVITPIIPHGITGRPSSSFAMIVTPFTNGIRPENGKPPGSSQSNSTFGQGSVLAPPPGSGLSAGHSSAPPGNLQNPSAVYHHIHELSAKRISTLEYLRKA